MNMGVKSAWKQEGRCKYQAMSNTSRLSVASVGHLCKSMQPLCKKPRVAPSWVCVTGFEQADDWEMSIVPFWSSSRSGCFGRAMSCTDSPRLDAASFQSSKVDKVLQS